MIEELQGTKAVISEQKTLTHEKVRTKKPHGFFQEDNGSYSSMRLMSFLSLFGAVLFGVLTVFLNSHGRNDGGNGLFITFGFLLGAFAPKAIQKFAEQKIPKSGD